MVKSLIRDGEESFPESVCQYVRLKSAELRMLYARCRSREKLLQGDAKRAETPAEQAIALARLQEVEAMVIFMASNCKEG